MKKYTGWDTALIILTGYGALIYFTITGMEKGNEVGVFGIFSIIVWTVVIVTLMKNNKI